MIAIDWGTSTFRAFRLEAGGQVIDRRTAPRGILAIEGGRFEEELRRQVGGWIADGETRLLMSGMIGSRQGWREAAYLPCPAGPAELAAALVAVPFDGAKLLLVPGLSHHDDAGTPEVMRGEETQLAGVLVELGSAGVACLPGSHSKWARIADGRVAGFATYLSGEVFAALRGHTILGRMMRDGATDTAAFERGVARSADPGHLLHHLFGVRTLGLFGRLSETDSASYLSGLLVGHEVRAARPADGRVHLIGSAALCSLYARTIAACGGSAIIHDEDAAARGLARIGKDARWT
jgi:2-dehydro-3-deoxygalactonokinase